MSGWGQWHRLARGQGTLWEVQQRGALCWLSPRRGTPTGPPSVASSGHSRTRARWGGCNGGARASRVGPLPPDCTPTPNTQAPIGLDGQPTENKGPPPPGGFLGQCMVGKSPQLPCRPGLGIRADAWVASSICTAPRPGGKPHLVCSFPQNLARSPQCHGPEQVSRVPDTPQRTGPAQPTHPARPGCSQGWKGAA